jgi:hypothetical protein
MASKFRQFVVYSKVTLLCVVFLAVGYIVFRNRNFKTNFWPGADGEPVPTLWLMLATSLVSIVVFWVVLRTRRVFRELAEVRADRAASERLAEQGRLKRQLEEQERRIDEKLKRAVGDDKSQP